MPVQKQAHHSTPTGNDAGMQRMGHRHANEYTHIQSNQQPGTTKGHQNQQVIRENL